MTSFLLHLVGILVLVYAVWGLLLLFTQPKLLYHPIREVIFTPADLGLEFEEVAFRSTDGIELTGWYIPAQIDRGASGDCTARAGCVSGEVVQTPADATGRRNEPRNRSTPDAPFTVLVCHGNGGNIGHLRDSLALLSCLGLNCFAFDYRGYGHSSGRPTEAGTYLDAQAAYDWLAGVKGIPPERIVLLGRSLGASVAAHLAGRVRAAGLVAESAFTSYLDIAVRFYPYLPVRLFRRFLFRYDTLAYIQAVRCPVLVLHSREDELVPFVFATRLFEAANEPKQFVELVGDHNEGFLLSGDVYTGAWRQWLDFVKDYQTENVVPGES
jgi:pimeloyl-ACP methyl ester carboxylesterase